MYARQQMLQFCVCLFSFKERAWPGMSCDNLRAWGHWLNPSGPSRENPNAVRGDRDVKAHLKSCNNILTDIESIDCERKLLLALAGESTGKVTFSVIERRLTCKSYKLLTHRSVPFIMRHFRRTRMSATHDTIVPNTGTRTGFAGELAEWCAASQQKLQAIIQLPTGEFAE